MKNSHSRTVVLLVVLGVCLAAFCWYKMQPEQLAISQIEKLGGCGWYTISGLIADFSGSTITDAELEHLKRLTDIKVLGLTHTQVTDAGLKHLRGLTNLRILDIDDTQITGAGLEHLKGLTNLDSLTLDSMQVTDAGLENLNLLTNLNHLTLTGAQITDERLEQLRKALPKCKITTYYSPDLGLQK